MPLGYYPVPGQVAPAQPRQDHESETTATLTEIADEFRASGIDVPDVLVFTHDRTDTIDRVANEYDCDVVLTLREGERIERVLVPVRGGTGLERIVSLLAGVMRMSDVSSDEASPYDELTELAREYDRLVLGETEPSLRERILGTVPSRIVDEVDRPAFVKPHFGSSGRADGTRCMVLRSRCPSCP